MIPHAVPVDRVPMATQLRGTVLVGSLRALRKRGYEPAYLTLLPRCHHADVAALTAATWLPMGFALAHYRACDGLALPRQEIEDIGTESGRFVNDTVLAALARLSQESGLSPWTAMSYVPKLMSRTFVGSSIAIWKLGPKEARLEWAQIPLAAVPYFRLAWAAFAKGMLGMFARTLLVREVGSVEPARRAPQMAIRVSWV